MAFLINIQQEKLICRNGELYCMLKTDWEKIYQRWMDVYRNWIANNHNDILEKYNKTNNIYCINEDNSNED